MSKYNWKPGELVRYRFEDKERIAVVDDSLGGGEVLIREYSGYATNVSETDIIGPAYDFTPGPWAVKRTRKVGAAKPDRAIIYQESDYGKQVCVINLQGHSLKEQDANAALLAAAPELLEALQMLSLAANHKDRVAAMSKASAAIAKATGEA